MMSVRNQMIGFLAAGLVLLTGFNAAGRYLGDGPALRSDPAKLARIKPGSAIILGNSTARGISFDKMCMDGVNLARPSQDRFELATVAELVLKREEVPATWVIALSPIGEGIDNGAKGSGRRLHARKRTYRLLWKEGNYSLVDRDWRAALSAAITPSLGLRAWSAQAFNVFGEPAALAFTSASVRALENRDPQADPAAEAARVIGYTSALVTEIAYYDSNVSARSRNRLKQVFTKITAAGGKVIIIVPPVSAELERQWTAKMPDQAAQFAKTITDFNDLGYPVVNYLDHPNFRNQPAQFEDAMHLTDAGNIVLSSDLGQKLRALTPFANSQCETR